VNIHTDTLNESGFVENTINAFRGRTIHTYHRFISFSPLHAPLRCFLHCLCLKQNIEVLFLFVKSFWTVKVLVVDMHQISLEFVEWKMYSRHQPTQHGHIRKIL